MVFKRGAFLMRGEDEGCAERVNPWNKKKNSGKERTEPVS
jgi:hypothetical protein